MREMRFSAELRPCAESQSGKAVISNIRIEKYNEAASQISGAELAIRK